jgi:hypothetical protein
MPKTNAENQKAHRERVKQKGLAEVRGAYAPKDKHPEIKKEINDKYGDMK